MLGTAGIIRVTASDLELILRFTRYVGQRPEKKAHLDLLPIVKSAVSIPMIANGDVFKYEDIAKVKQITTCSSVLIGRGALWNCSVFQPKSIPAIDVALDLFDRVTMIFNSLRKDAL